jgi:hypothetical protein
VPYQFFLYERLGTDAGWYSGITDKNGRAYFAFVPCFNGSGFGSSNRVGVIKNDGTLQMAWPFNWQTTCGDFDLLLAVNPATVSNARYNAGEMPWPFPCVGQPVNVTTGNMWIKHEDYAVEDLNVTRTYNSAVQESGVFGFGWSSSLDTRLRTPFINPNPQQNISLVQLELGSGRLVSFVRSGTTGLCGGNAGFLRPVGRGRDRLSNNLERRPHLKFFFYRTAHVGKR